jgi:hypothetical protein
MPSIEQRIRKARMWVMAGLAALICAASPARAASPMLRLGGDYLLDGGPGLFSLTLGVDTHIARAVSVGGRFGGLVTTGDPATAGVPLDLVLRVTTGRVYFEGLAGPWIFFSGDTVRGHAAFGFGLRSREVEFGAEVGWLSGFSRAMLGVRLGFPI